MQVTYDQFGIAMECGRYVELPDGRVERIKAISARHSHEVSNGGEPRIVCADRSVWRASQVELYRTDDDLLTEAASLLH